MKSNINIPCLHEDEKIFKELINLASVHFGVVAEQVEKDYWITRMLKQLEQSRYKDNFYLKAVPTLLRHTALLKDFQKIWTSISILIIRMLVEIQKEN